MWIWESVRHIYAFLAVIPVIPFAIIYWGYGAFVHDKKKAFMLAMDVTTALLVGCVAVLFDRIFGSSFGVYLIILVLLLLGGFIGNMQFRKRGSVDSKKVFRAVWRIGFLFMSALYVLFMFIGIGKVLLLPM
ncbi:uncharacterized protein DUF3397 [Paenibacillus cellulosilyticus]|uniref:Uncharacterized protein DUF3397 n=1 Tax=Paenibacillus cellulosilyticus TaxID=375489 RepID=A0A2V2YMK8_9BACL|nr:DUF3397 domain-containing protein [Paenibacillus cellulosilyticus]PWV95453.1 uncharacterized protein DUF3397 [Paenibacillus cellulosilyticus]QKS43172.1 DUF3397 domain-containing protein [Paenibacillus cellulosilyticus]